MFVRLTVSLDQTHAFFAAAVWLRPPEAHALVIATDRQPCVAAQAARQGPASRPRDGR